MAELDPLTLNVADIFTGAGLPKDSVTVMMNAELAHRVATLTKSLDDAQAAGDANTAEALEKQRDEAREAANAFAFRFDVQAVPRHVRDQILNEEMGERPRKFDILGREEPSPERDEAITVRYWAASIRRITRLATGAEMTPTVSDVATIRGQAPDPALLDINKCIDGLYAETNAGYEDLAMGHDFLSQP